MVETKDEHGDRYNGGKSSPPRVHTPPPLHATPPHTSVNDLSHRFEHHTPPQDNTPIYSDSPHHKPVSSQKLEKLRAGSVVKCEICAQAVYAQEKHVFRGGVYHRHCFVCVGCGVSLVNEGAEVLDDVMYCRPCLSREIVRRTGLEATHGQTAQEAGLRRKPSHSGDVLGVIEEIGDELEASISSNIPRCERCGGLFTSDDNIVIMGMSKAHKVCPEKQAIATMSPEAAARIAMKSSPESITIRMERKQTGEKVTIFFDKDMTDNKSHHNSVTYHPHSNSRRSSTRLTRPIDATDDSAAFTPDQLILADLNDSHYAMGSVDTLTDSNGDDVFQITLKKKLPPLFHLFIIQLHYDMASRALTPLSLQFTVSPDEEFM